MKTQSWQLDAWRVMTGFLRTTDELAESACLKCESPLDLHQPDAESPEVLLGTCAACGAWHIMAPGPEGADLLVVERREAGEAAPAGRTSKLATPAPGSKRQ